MRILPGVICACIYQDLSCSAISATYLPWWRAISSSRLSRMTHHGLPPLLNVFYSSAVFFCMSSQPTAYRRPDKGRTACVRRCEDVMSGSTVRQPSRSSQARQRTLSDPIPAGWMSMRQHDRTVQAAAVRATAGGHRHLSYGKRVFPRAFWLSPCGVAFEGARRRPVRHRGWDRIVIQGFERTRPPDDFSAHHR